MTSNHHFTPLLAVIVVALLGGGCAWESTALVVSPSGMMAFVGTTWVATEIDGAAATLVPPDLVFENDRRFHGSSGCNRYVGELNRYVGELNPTTPSVRVGHVGTTRMTCEPPLMEQEHRFVNTLQFVATSHVDGDAMQFRDRTGQIRIRFRRMNAAGSR
jgi:heat shock protein HslJ